MQEYEVQRGKEGVYLGVYVQYVHMGLFLYYTRARIYPVGKRALKKERAYARGRAEKLASRAD